MSEGDAADLTRQQAERGLVIWTLARYIGWAIILVSAWIPLQVVSEIADTLAGKETVVDVKLAFTATVTLAFTGGAAVMLKKMRAQRDEIMRLRGRLEAYETVIMPSRGADPDPTTSEGGQP